MREAGSLTAGLLALPLLVVAGSAPGRALARESGEKSPAGRNEPTTAAEAPSFALVGGTVYPVAGEPIRDGVVVVRDGKIESVGPRSDIEIPAGLERISVEGKSVIPGLVAITSGLVLEGGGASVSASQAFQDIEDELDPLDPSIPILLREGITTLGLAPGAASATGGLGLALKLEAEPASAERDSPSLDELERLRVLKPRAFLTLELGKVGRGLGARASTNVDRLNQYYALRGVFTGAKAYEKVWETYRESAVKYNEALRKWRASNGKSAKGKKATPGKKAGDSKAESGPADGAEKDPARRRGFATDRAAARGEDGKEEEKKEEEKEKKEQEKKKDDEKKTPEAPKPPKRPGVNETFEVILRAMSGELPVWVVAHGRDDIGYAIRLKQDFGLDLTVLGATEAYRRAGELRKAGIPVVVWPVLNREIDVRLRNHRESNPRSLADAGVSVSIGSLDDDVLVARLLRWQAAVAVRGGLSKPAALRAITLEAATRLGVEKQVGSIEKGKDADLVVIQGDPLSATAPVERVFVDGISVGAAAGRPEGGTRE